AGDCVVSEPYCEASALAQGSIVFRPVRYPMLLLRDVVWRAEPRTTPGGQPVYSPLAIETALTLRAVFRLPLSQTEGLIGSIIGLLGLDLDVPDHSTLSRRAETLQVFARSRSGAELPPT